MDSIRDGGGRFVPAINGCLCACPARHEPEDAVAVGLQLFLECLAVLHVALREVIPVEVNPALDPDRLAKRRRLHRSVGAAYSHICSNETIAGAELKEFRSNMNVTWRIQGNNEELEKKFIDEAKKRGDPNGPPRLFFLVNRISRWFGPSGCWRSVRLW